MEGEIRMGPRPNDTPYFRTDLTLLSALADVFSYLLLNVRLQEKKQEQEKREQELILDVSRSQLKALRAQVNPHFLFNALNIIASLVHRDPDRAEATVEQLADVFRYTLSRSDQEWVRVEDEVEFLESYLRIEKVRFGDRLVAVIDIDPETLEVPIPSMAIQTLLENAFKHGISGLRGVGRVEVRVRREQDELLVQVSDNGPGIDTVSGPARKRSGYGLSNVRSRLAGYFGDAASLELSRDEVAGKTVATLRMPITPFQGERRRAL
jgi:LytS/YehU family sensor histidine kinase